MRRVGDQVALGVEKRTRKIEPFFDVDRVRRVLQLQAHLLGDVHEQVIEHLQHHRVGTGAQGQALGARLVAFEQQVAMFV